MKKYHQVTNVRFEGDRLHLTIDGQDKQFKLGDISSTLQQASEQEKNIFEISPSGYGIHWPLLDEDLSIDGLLGIVHTPRKKMKSV
jgi:hypothetical protein